MKFDELSANNTIEIVKLVNECDAFLHTGNISESQISAHGDESDDDGDDDDDDDDDGGGGGGGGDGGGGLALTLDFNLAAIHRRPDRHTRLVAATLNLRKKLTRADNGR